ncbi:MAG TPA: PQQ-binding-like beta-propeller repeat protein [Polyangiaceae bacterium]|nr:PQQ-binding-like beta-propeller repeat protein [Polyangiaceae bacterium]
MTLPSRFFAAFALAAIVTAVLGAESDLARGADARVAFREPANALAGITLGERIDAGGNDESRARLPRAPAVGFQTRLAPPIVGAPVVSEAGVFVVAHGRDRISALDAAGHLLWSAHLGAELASGPIPFGAARYLAVTRDARLFEIASGGSVVERAGLDWSSVDGNVLFAPTVEGGAIVATGARLARVAPGGARGFGTKVGAGLRAVFDWRGATLAVGRDGSIWLRGSAGDARELGSFGVPVGEVMLRGDRLLALTAHELASFDLATDERALVWSDATLELHDVATTRDERIAVVAGRATLVVLEANGHELARFALPSSENGAELSSVVIDGTGAMLVGASGSPLLAVTREGDATSVPGSGCSDPLRPTPVADGRVFEACRSGLVRGLSDKAR